MQEAADGLARVPSRQRLQDDFRLVPAATSAVAAATAAARATAATAAPAPVTATTAATATAATAPPFLTRAGFVYCQGPAAKHRPVERCDGRVRPVTHFHEAEATRPARLPVLHDLSRDHSPVLGELRPQIVFRGGEGKIPNI